MHVNCILAVLTADLYRLKGGKSHRDELNQKKKADRRAEARLPAVRCHACSVAPANVRRRD